MPAKFYARYIPADTQQNVNDDEGQDINPRPRKKKKTNGTANSASTKIVVKQSATDADISTISEPANGVAKKRKRSREKNIESSKFADSADEKDIEGDIDDKHKSIRTKYKQASKKSEEASKGSSHDLHTDAENDLEVVQPLGLQPLPQPRRVQDEPRSNISALPEWMIRPLHASKRLPFTELDLSPELSDYLSKAGFETAFPVQTTVIPMLMKRDIQYGSDICVSASTGSGKTLAYTLPIVEALKNKPVIRLRALIIVPTRELVNQVQEVFRLTRSSLKVGVAVGSNSLKDERKKLIEVDQIYDPEAYQQIHIQNAAARGNSDDQDLSSEADTDHELPMQDYVVQRSSKVDVLICTPGRLVDHLRTTKGFSLQHIQWLVIDEADRLLDQSFQQWIDLVMPQLERKPIQDQSIRFRGSNHIPMPHRIVRKVVLSATMTRDYSKLLALELKNPILVVSEAMQDVQRDAKPIKDFEAEPIFSSIPEKLIEVAVTVRDAAEKPLYLLQLIEMGAAVHAATNGIHDAARTGFMKHGSIANGSSEDTSSDHSEDDSVNTPSATLDSEADTSDEASSSSAASSDISENQHATMSSLHVTSNHGFLVFVNTNESALRLCRLLVILRPSWSTRILPLTKSVGTSSGRKALAAFRQRKADIIVATDLASRGLDLKHLAQVINYDMPRSLTTYIHRIGRTARAGQSGIASTLVCHHEARWFWKELGQSTDVDRMRKIGRKELHIEISDREAYEGALETLGKEAKGNT